MYTCKLQIKIGDLKFFNFLIFVRNLIRLFYITLYNCINHNENESF